VPGFGTIVSASAAIPGRITVLTGVLKSDGSLDFNQSLLLIPGRPFPNEQVAYGRYGQLTYGRLLRLLQIGQKLYRTGELAGQASREYVDDDVFRGLHDLLYGKWVDPLLGCMGYLAGRRADPTWFALKNTAANLMRYFAGLPDARVIYGLEYPEEQPRVYGELIRSNALPVLLESAGILAEYATRNGAADAGIVEMVHRATPGQPWCQFLLPSPDEARAAKG
jgi:hypothetical protein